MRISDWSSDVCSSDLLKFGLVLGSRRFRNIVGAANALSILGSARTFGAQEAFRIGFVDQIVSEAEWPDILAQAAEVAVALDARTRASLYQALDTNDHNADLAELVRSASRSGLKGRISNYMQA